MDKILHQFFQSAKQVRLSEKEKNAAREALQRHAVSVRMGASDRLYDQETLLSSAQSMKLTSLEKGHAFDRIFRYMQSRPVGTPLNEPSSSLWYWCSMHRLTATVLIIALLVSSGGGLTYAAEGSMPDDLLYPVKVSFSEPLSEFIAWTPEEKARVRLKHLRRRLTETGHLSRQTDLPSVHAERMQERLSSAIAGFEEKLQELSDADASEELILQYEELLDVHEKALASLEDTSLPPEEMRSLIHDVKKARRDAFGERGLHDSLSDEEKLERFRSHLLRKKENRMKHMEQFLEDVKDVDDLPEDVQERVQDVEERLEHLRGSDDLPPHIEQRLEEAKKRIENGESLRDLRLQSGEKERGDTSKRMERKRDLLNTIMERHRNGQEMMDRVKKDQEGRF